MIFVGIGGGLGAISRYALGRYITKKHNSLFPFGHFFINIIGSIILGIVYHLSIEKNISSSLWLFIGVGILGGFTTFSTFGYETIQLILMKKYKLAIFYSVFSTILCIFGSYLGYHFLSITYK